MNSVSILGAAFVREIKSAPSSSNEEVCCCQVTVLYVCAPSGLVPNGSLDHQHISSIPL